MPVELLSIETDEHEDWWVVRASGQLDVATSATLRQALIEAQYGGGTRVALDLTAVEFIDSFGLGVIVGAVKRARTHDGEVAIVCDRARVARILELAGLDRVVPIVGTRSELPDGQDGA